MPTAIEIATAINGWLQRNRHILHTKNNNNLEM